MAKTVLVVEDDVEINELLGEYLALEEMTYVAAFRGKDGMDKVDREPPDAVILDLMLPDVDGFHVCKHIASHRATADIPVIMLTCCNSPEDQQKGLESGALRYMNKPFLPDDLINNLRSAFQWKTQLKQRPPRGQIELTAGQWPHMLHCVNEMAVDLFCRTELPDAAVGAIREGFQGFGHWVKTWSETNKRDPHMVIEYRLTTGTWDELAIGRPPEAIEWVVSELDPGILADTVFKSPTSNSTWAALKTSSQTDQGELGPWYQFLAKSGVDRFEKDTRLGQVRLSRLLRKTQDGVPLVTIDGARMPTRLLAEARAGK